MPTDAALAIAGIMALRLVVGVERGKHATRKGIEHSISVQLVDDTMDKWQKILEQFQQGKMGLQAHTGHRRMNHANRPRIL